LVFQFPKAAADIFCCSQSGAAAFGMVIASWPAVCNQASRGCRVAAKSGVAAKENAKGPKDAENLEGNENYYSPLWRFFEAFAPLR
jgi:hypothetical protein